MFFKKKKILLLQKKTENQEKILSMIPKEIIDNVIKAQKLTEGYTNLFGEYIFSEKAENILNTLFDNKNQ